MHPRNCKILLIHTGTCELCVRMGVRGSGHGGGGTALGWAGPTAGGMPTTDAGANEWAYTAAGSDATRPCGCVPSAPGSTVNELEMPEPPSRTEQAPKGAGRASHM